MSPAAMAPRPPKTGAAAKVIMAAPPVRELVDTVVAVFEAEVDVPDAVVEVVFELELPENAAGAGPVQVND